MKNNSLFDIFLISSLFLLLLIISLYIYFSYKVPLVSTNNSKHIEMEKVEENAAEEIPEEIKDVITEEDIVNKKDKLIILKDVGEAYLDNFGLKENDYILMHDMNIDIIEGNFDICATNSDVQNFLDNSYKYNIKTIMPAGSGEAEWGYECDVTSFPKDQKPSWQKEKVLEWIKKWKDHPAIYAWDISNEAGSVFPNPSSSNMLSNKQLKQAYDDIKSIDKVHPIMIRMNGWYFYDFNNNFFRNGNPFQKDIADIVMVNAYSNVSEYFEDFVYTVTNRAIKSIKEIDSDVSIAISLGLWEEPPLWVRPNTKNTLREIEILRNTQSVQSIAFFKYGAKESEWYLPDNKDLINLLYNIK
jgi:hypothetical protein